MDERGPQYATPPGDTASASPEASGRLDSWKEIAAYLKHSERTVRRWEKEGLPVRRHPHKKKAAIFAYKAEIDAWWRNGQPRLEQQEQPVTLLRRLWRPWRVAAGIGVPLAVVGMWLYFTERIPQKPLPPLRVLPFTSYPGNVSYPAFSPDGNQIAFVWDGEAADNADIYVKLIGAERPLRLTHEAAFDCCPTWSPDGRQLAFVRMAGEASGIFTVPALGGAERKLASLRDDRYFHLAWSPDGTQLAFAERSSPQQPYSVFLLSLDTLGKRQLTSPPAQTEGDRRFAFSPDGKTLAFIRIGNPTGAIYVLPVSGGKPRKLIAENSWIHYITWAADGQTLFFSSDRDATMKLWRIPASGGIPELVGVAGENVFFPAVAQRGNRLAFVRESIDSNLWRIELASATGPAKSIQALSSSTRFEGGPDLSPDNKRIAFRSDRSGSPEIWISHADGSNAVQLTSFGGPLTQAPRWSPDGRQIVFNSQGSPLRPVHSIHIVSAEGGLPRRLTEVPINQGSPSWSRDGKWIYFHSYTAGENQVWKIPAQGGQLVQVTKHGGFVARESPDGRFVYYTKVDSPGIWRVPIEGGEEIRVVDILEPGDCGYWAVVDEGIYFLNRKAGSRPTIEFYNFSTRRISPAAKLTGDPDPWAGGLTVSSDRRWIIYSQVAYQDSNIMLLENFR